METQTIEQAIGFDKFRTLYQKDTPDNIVLTRWNMVKSCLYKHSGVVQYFFKPKNKYPARIYVFIHAEEWKPRNRKPMALSNKFPFITRPMTEIELLEDIPNTRLSYFQYEYFEDLILAKKSVESPQNFIEELQTFKNKFKLTK